MKHWVVKMNNSPLSILPIFVGLTTFYILQQNPELIYPFLIVECSIIAIIILLGFVRAIYDIIFIKDRYTKFNRNLISAKELQEMYMFYYLPSFKENIIDAEVNNE